MKEKTMDPVVDNLRVIGLMEGVSFLVLLSIAMPLKYLAGMPIAVRIAGSLHGALFILFMVALFQVRTKAGWPLKKVVFAFVAALLPFGPFVLDRKLREENKALST